MNTSKSPKLSIITVNYNNKDGLIKTLESLKSQSFTDYEHLIIDASSSDGSVDVIREYALGASNPITWVSEKDKGIYDGMNKGIQKAIGDYVYFLNSGDCLMHDVLKDIDFDGTQYIYGDMLLDQGDKGLLKRMAPEHPELFFFVSDSLSHQACFIHRSLFEDHLYDLRYRIVADWAHSFQSIVLEGCSFKHLPMWIAVCDGTGISSVYTDVQNERCRWLEENLSEPMLQSVADLVEYRSSGFHKVVPRLVQTRRFKRWMKSLVSGLFKIHAFLSYHHFDYPGRCRHDILADPLGPKRKKRK